MLSFVKYERTAEVFFTTGPCLPSVELTCSDRSDSGIECRKAVVHSSSQSGRRCNTTFQHSFALSLPSRFLSRERGTGLMYTITGVRDKFTPWDITQCTLTLPNL